MLGTTSRQSLLDVISEEPSILLTESILQHNMDSRVFTASINIFTKLQSAALRQLSSGFGRLLQQKSLSLKRQRESPFVEISTKKILQETMNQIRTNSSKPVIPQISNHQAMVEGLWKRINAVERIACRLQNRTDVPKQQIHSKQKENAFVVRVHPSPVRFKCRFTYQTPEKYEANKIANSPDSAQRVRVSHKSSTKKQKILITSKFLSPEPGRASSRGRNGSNA